MTTAHIDKALAVGCEAAIVLLFRSAMGAKDVVLEDRIPLNQALDTAVYEMSFKFGRADIVIFHVDGSASVIEVKDGSRGYAHVVAGIGQAALYAAQLAMNKGALTKVRKCLLWTSTGNLDLDAMIEDTCLQSGTVPLPWGSLDKHLSETRAAIEKIVGKEITEIEQNNATQRD